MLTLNCDLGEGLDEIDALIMPYLSRANIACGGHAGDAASMTQTIGLAKKYGVKIGAHPSYPDRANFGRKPMKIATGELTKSLIEQTAQLRDFAVQHRVTVDYIKPHGALYNDSQTPNILQCLIATAQYFHLPLMLLAGVNSLEKACSAAGVKLIKEAFADRRYGDNGLLVNRNHPNALLNAAQSLLQTQNLSNGKKVQTESGRWLALECDTLCIHSDTKGALETAKKISQWLQTKAN